MPKFFVTSDIHSHYKPLTQALDEAGFDPNNKDHWLVVCGDIFDRGDDSGLVLQFIMSLERKILVCGNHDLLLRDLCKRGFPYRHDFHNGTTTTVYDLGDAGMGNDFDKCCEVTQNKLKEYNGLLVNYFETQNYIFVHSWIPTNVAYDERASKPWHQVGKTYSYKEDWRNATEKEWEEAMWGNPFKLADQDLNKTGKTIVFGHWHCSAGHRMLGHCGDEFEYAIWEPCYFKNTIGIDRCTAHTGEVNVLIIEDEFLED